MLSTEGTGWEAGGIVKRAQGRGEGRTRRREIEHAIELVRSRGIVFLH